MNVFSYFLLFFLPLERCSKGYIWRFVDVESLFFLGGGDGIAWQRLALRGCLRLWEHVEEKIQSSGGKFNI